MELNELTNEELEKINCEIIRQIVIEDLEYYTNQNMKETFINSILGEIENDKNLINDLIDKYKKGTPYIGYYHKYLSYKKRILKEKFGIELDTGDENNTLSVD